MVGRVVVRVVGSVVGRARSRVVCGVVRVVRVVGW